MEAHEIETQLDQVLDRLDAEESVTVFRVENQPFSGFVFDRSSLVEFVEEALDRGVRDFYLLEDRTEDERIELGGVCYFYEERAHTCYLQVDDREASAEGDIGEATTDRQVSFGRQESKDERARKQELAEELLSEYEEYLDEDQRYEIENRLDRMPLRRVLQIHDQTEAAARVDPEEEKRLARVVYEDDRFSHQFNQTDTEMLLDELDVEFDGEQIRFEEVHKRAKSLIKINR